MPDTIAAIATPQLPSAIGILRLSGPDTRRILDVVFSPAHGGLVSGQAPRRMVLGDLHDRQGRIIDSALAVLFPGPHSYTGEDCAEIHCHGSPVVLNEGLDARGGPHRRRISRRRPQCRGAAGGPSQPGRGGDL